MMGDGRARAQTRLAVRSGREANSAKPHGPRRRRRLAFRINCAGNIFSAQTSGSRRFRHKAGADKVWQTLLAGPPVQAAKDVPHTLAGLRAVALDPMYQLR
jgi:hypothetical protein